MSRKDSARPGKWRHEPHQPAIMDAFSDPRIRKVVVMAASQVVGKSQMMNNVVGYYIHQDPSNMMIVHPKIDAAEKWSKGRFDPLIEFTPVLKEIVPSRKARDKENTILHRQFRGGQMFVVGANAPADLAAQSVRIVMVDEVDRIEVSAGSGDRAEGDPLELAEQRTETYGDFAKVGYFSTPLKKGLSRIEAAFKESDQREWEVRCQDPECRQWFAPRWHHVRWSRRPNGRPDYDTARMTCGCCGVSMTEGQRLRAIEEGRWTAQAEFDETAGFHINALGCKKCGKGGLIGLVKRWYKVKDIPERVKTFFNLVLAESFADPGAEVPNWELVYKRAERYPLGKVPHGGLLLVSGVDVQGDRIEVGVWAFGRRHQSWLVHYEVVPGDPALSKVWRRLDEIMATDWPHEDGGALPIRCMCIDSGGRYTNQVYGYVGKRRQPSHGPAGTIARLPRTFAAIRGMDSWKGVLVSVATPESAKNRRFGAYVFTLGVSYVKSEIMGWLKAEWPDEEAIRNAVAEEGDSLLAYPHGACHISDEVGESYARQLCSEVLIRERKRGIEVQKWDVMPGERNEVLDAMVYARSAAFLVGMDRFRESHWRSLEKATRPVVATEPDPSMGRPVPPEALMREPPPPRADPPAAARPPRRTARKAGGWLGSRGGDDWLSRRR